MWVDKSKQQKGNKKKLKENYPKKSLKILFGDVNL